LGYPLHAFEDATFPHHIACTTSWGHRPMEDAANDMRTDILKYDTQTDAFGAYDSQTHAWVTDCHRPVEIVLQGYAWWKYYGCGSMIARVEIDRVV
jgi:hypothetical protein